MKDLKEELFRKRRFYRRQSILFVKKFGRFSREAGLFLAKYNVLLDLIVDCGLEEEYEQWEERNNDI